MLKSKSSNWDYLYLPNIHPSTISKSVIIYYWKKLIRILVKIKYYSAKMTMNFIIVIHYFIEPIKIVVW